MEIYERSLIKDHSLLIEEIPIVPTNRRESHLYKQKLHVKTQNNQNNQEFTNHVSQD